MFELWPSDDANHIVKSGVGLIHVDLFLVFDGVCKVTEKIGSVSGGDVSSAKVLSEVLEMRCFWNVIIIWRCIFFEIVGI